jgi:cell division protein FtsB
MRTKAEVRSYLESVIGQSVDANCGDYQGQCVSLIKGLFNFLGVPNPYIPRGNAKDAANTYVNQGIATNGDGWLRICVNKNMGLIGGVYYGHIWVDLQNEVNYEQNGKTALRVTKNTRPITQAQQIVNLDKWIKADSGGGSSMAETYKSTDDTSRQLGWHILGRNGYDGKPNALQSQQGDLVSKNTSVQWISQLFLSEEAREWRDSRVPKIYAELDALRSTNANLNTQVTQLSKAVAEANTKLTQANAQIVGLTQTVNEKQAEIDTLVDEVEALKKENVELKAQIATCGDGEDTEWLNKIGEALRWLITRLGVKK